MPIMRNKRIFISAGEVSGDLLGAEMMRELKNLIADCEFVGIGGRNMCTLGLKALSEDVTTMSIIGILEALPYLSKQKKIFQSAIRTLRNESFDAVLLIDNQGFHIPLAKMAKKLGHKVIYYFAPHVSVYGAWNAPKLSAVVDCLFPSLPADYEVYRQYTDKAFYFGHPLVDRIRNFQPDQEFLKKLSLSENQRTVSLFPGSRYQEIKALLPIMLDAARILIEQHSIQILLPVSHPDYEALVVSIIENAGMTGRIKVFSQNSYAAMVLSDAMILSSGTASLESVLFGKPPVICYRISALTFLIGKMLVKKAIVGLPNILLDKVVFPELLQKDCNPHAIVEKTLDFLSLERKSAWDNAINQVKRIAGEYPIVEKIARKILETIEHG